MLHAIGIPYEIVVDENTCTLMVPDNMVEKAKYELWQYDTENRKPTRRSAALTPQYQSGIWGVVVYVMVISVVAWLAAEATFNRDWFSAGRVDGALIRDGEWWRSVTALTLHSGIRHLIGNIGFGILFGLMAGALVGPGVAWLAIVLSSGAANILNTVLLESSHRAIGASTAVFAALGLVAGYSWRAKLMAQDSWPRRFGPVIGGLALLAYTGTGDANTDIGAHLAGFACGFFAGVVMTKFSRYLPRRNIQRAAGIIAVSLVVLAWTAALRL